MDFTSCYCYYLSCKLFVIPFTYYVVTFEVFFGYVMTQAYQTAALPLASDTVWLVVVFYTHRKALRSAGVSLENAPGREGLWKGALDEQDNTTSLAHRSD